MNTTITQQQLKDVLDYSPETGIFTWKPRPSCRFKSIGSWKIWNTRFAGKPAGVVNCYQYRVIRVVTEQHQAHRLAWLFMTGNWPKDRIDHRDGVTTNNRFGNLRECNMRQNSCNQKLRKGNKTGVNGVSYNPKTSKWIVQIRIGEGKQIHFPPFNTKEEAIKARRDAELKYHGEFASHLRPLRA